MARAERCLIKLLCSETLLESVLSCNATRAERLVLPEAVIKRRIGSTASAYYPTPRDVLTPHSVEVSATSSRILSNSTTIPPRSVGKPKTCPVAGQHACSCGHREAVELSCSRKLFLKLHAHSAIANSSHEHFRQVRVCLRRPFFVEILRLRREQ